MWLSDRNGRRRGACLVVALACASSGGDAAAQSATDLTAASLERMVAEGEGIYRSKCARCHGENGKGQQHSHDSPPRLYGSYAGLAVDEITVQVLRGGAYMPPFNSLTDREIAAVTAYVRNSFGNALGPVTEGDVASRR